VRSLFNFHDFVVFAGSIRNQFTNLLWVSFIFRCFCFSVSQTLYFLRRIWKSQSENYSVIDWRGARGSITFQNQFAFEMHNEIVCTQCNILAVARWARGVGSCSLFASWLAGFQIANFESGGIKWRMKMENAGGSVARWLGGTHTALSPFWQLLIIATVASWFRFFYILYLPVHIYIYISFYGQRCVSSCNCHLLFDQFDQ